MKILIVNPFGIGDVLFSTPLISNLKAAMPESFIAYICNIRAKDALSDNPQLDEIFVFEKDEYRNLWKNKKLRCIKSFISFLIRIKKRQFDVVIDLSLGYQYSLFLWLLGVKKRIGYNYRNRGRFLTDKIDISGYNDKPISDYYLQLLEFLNIKPGIHNLTMPVSESDLAWADEFLKHHGVNKGEVITGVIPAGGASWGKNFSYRHWPWENYARLADKIGEELKAKVLILGAVSEQNICRQVQGMMKTHPLNACGMTTLKQFAALLGRCNLVVCNDGGPLHVAVSQGVKTVSIFGPVDEKVYGPYPPGKKHIIITRDIECRPCYRCFKLPVCYRMRQCIRDISVEQVFKVVKDNLSLTI